MVDDSRGARKSSWVNASEPALRDGASDPFSAPGSDEPLPNPSPDELPYAAHHAGVGPTLDLDLFSDGGENDSASAAVGGQTSDAAFDVVESDPEGAEAGDTDLARMDAATVQPQLWSPDGADNPFALGITPTVDLATLDDDGTDPLPVRRAEPVSARPGNFAAQPPQPEAAQTPTHVSGTHRAPIPGFGATTAPAPEATPATAFGGVPDATPAPAPAPALGGAPEATPAPAPAFGGVPDATPAPAPAPAFGGAPEATPAPAPAFGRVPDATPAPAPAFGGAPDTLPAPAPAPAFGGVPDAVAAQHHNPTPETSSNLPDTDQPGQPYVPPASPATQTQPPTDLDTRAETAPAHLPPADTLPIGTALVATEPGHDLGDLFDDDTADTQGPRSAPTLNVAVRLTPEQRSGVRDLIGLASSGDPALQSVVSNLEITQNPEKDAAQRAAYERAVTPLLHAKDIRVGNPTDFPIIMAAAYDHLLGLGPLAPLWRDPDVTDIMVTGPYRVVAERNGFHHMTDVTFDDLAHLHDIGRRLSTKVDDRGVSRRNCLVTVQLDRARVQLAWPPVARSGGNMAIRKHRRNLSLSNLLARKALSPDMAALLSDAVLARATILVSGGTSTGKTTYLNVASGFIPDTERVLILEDASELELTNTFTEYYLTKEKASADDTVVIGYDQLLEAVLRMNPDRVIVGEIRGPAGAAAVLEAASTGHEGTMSTIHSEGPAEALDRFVDKVRTHSGAPDDVVRKNVYNTFDVVVQVAKHQATGIRYVSDISVVADDRHMNRLFTGRVDVSESDDGTLAGTPRFERTQPLTSKSRLFRRMRNAGIDSTAWEKPVG